MRRACRAPPGATILRLGRGRARAGARARGALGSQHKVRGQKGDENVGVCGGGYVSEQCFGSTKTHEACHRLTPLVQKRDRAFESRKFRVLGRLQKDSASGAQHQQASMFALLFDLEDYATTYRATRDAYLKAANELKLATGAL